MANGVERYDLPDDTDLMAAAFERLGDDASQCDEGGGFGFWLKRLDQTAASVQSSERTVSTSSAGSDARVQADTTFA